MVKRILSMLLVSLLISAICVSSTQAASNEEKRARFIARVKESIAKLGTGLEARIELKLQDNTKLRGYVSVVGEDDFTVVNLKTGIPATVSYPQVKQVRGQNLSTGAKIAIGIGIGIGVLMVVLLVFKDRINAY